MAGIRDNSRSSTFSDCRKDEYNKSWKVCIEGQVMSNTLTLPDRLRDKLKEPLGQLVNNENLLSILKNEQYIVTIGDYVTFTLIMHRLYPIFCIVDYKIKRETCPSHIKKMLQSFGKKHVIVKNPPGVISDDLWNAIDSAYQNFKKNTICIEVEGEEDLAALPAIYLAPRDVTIIYGLPNRGVVVVKATEENKHKVKQILDEM
jgi:uncharacterized protein (UPF0218 family)